MQRRFLALAALAVAIVPFARASAASTADNAAGIDWVLLDGFEIARTETTVGQFRRWVQAAGVVTAAERAGGGQVYETGWVQKPGWIWATPFGPGRPAAADEPAVHINFTEAASFCRWAGGALPSDKQWASAAYTEQRATPPTPYQRGRTYAYPTGDRPDGAICLGDCGPGSAALAVRHGAVLDRGAGHAPAGRSAAGVNGLHDMGGNVWEWVDDPPGAAPGTERRTRGGSWWYGAGPMRADHVQTKPPGTAVVYIGWRCARPSQRSR